ncbi:MAG: hypothetical protein ACT4TC_20960 [Myxococcaceae bacterium]
MASTPETLGEVLLPSGAALIVDSGVLRLWCHDRPPMMPRGILKSEAAQESADAAQDFRIEGPDAELAGQLYGSRTLFDIPGHKQDELRQTFKSFLVQRGLDARLAAQPNRVTHLNRFALALRESGQLLINGVQAVAVDGLPVGKPLTVLSHLDSVTLEVRPAASVKTARWGTVRSDFARLMFVDPKALALWQHSDSVDGLADFVFWGQDAQQVAERFGASKLDDDVYGWKDLPVTEATTKGAEIEAAVTHGHIQLDTDFREHSHHHALLEQLRSSPTSSGTLDLAGARCCAFFTGVGEGSFPVFRELDAQGGLVRVRIALTPPQGR